MEKDRKVICDIISDMLDNPDEHGIYPTTIAYNRLEAYISGIRTKAEGINEGINKLYKDRAILLPSLDKVDAEFLDDYFKALLEEIKGVRNEG